jgi:DNA-binding NtrC family response regulator
MAKSLTGRRALMKLVEQSSTVMYLVDASRCILFANDACLRWLGATQDQLFGRSCAYATRRESDNELTAGLCPPPGAFAGYTCVTPIARITVPGTEPPLAMFLPLTVPDEDSWVLVIVGVQGAEARGFGRDRETVDARQLHHRVAMARQNTVASAADLLLGESLAVQRLRAQVKAAQSIPIPILVVGSDGSGRETLARAIHATREQHETSRLVPLDCRLLDVELLQMTLTAVLEAHRTMHRQSLTLLLLDVDQLHRETQSMLAQMLRRDASEVTVIATASHDLRQPSKCDPDLSSVLTPFVVELPSLAERLSDLPLLIQAIVERRNERAARQLEGVSREAMARLLNHPWHGDFEELCAVMVAAHDAATGTVIEDKHLPEILQLTADAEQYPRFAPQRIDLDVFLEQVERELMRRALRVARGNRAEAARLLGVSRARLLRRLPLIEDEPERPS